MGAHLPPLGPVGPAATASLPGSALERSPDCHGPSMKPPILPEMRSALASPSFWYRWPPAFLKSWRNLSASATPPADAAHLPLSSRILPPRVLSRPHM